jgi:hypothetical protein
MNVILATEFGFIWAWEAGGKRRKRGGLQSKFLRFQVQQDGERRETGLRPSKAGIVMGRSYQRELYPRLCLWKGLYT